MIFLSYHVLTDDLSELLYDNLILLTVTLIDVLILSSVAIVVYYVSYDSYKVVTIP